MEKFKWFGGNWSDESGLEEDFRTAEVLDFEIIIAWYECECYEGSSYVLAMKDGKLFENEAGHCSCYSLEDTWGPGEVTIEYLRERLQKGYFPGAVVDKMREFVDQQ